MSEVGNRRSQAGNKLSQVGNRRSQVGNKVGRRFETKEAKSSAEMTRSKIFKGKTFKKYFRPPLKHLKHLYIIFLCTIFVTYFTTD